MGRWLLGLVGLGLLAYLAFCAALWLGQTRLIFFPQPAPAMTPARADMPYEDVWIPVEKGHIHGWWLPVAAPQAKTVLILHGNASNVEGTLRQAQYFVEAGLSALVIDYRGYGLSSGPFPNEKRVYADAAAAWNYLTQTRLIPANDVIIFGHSIGGAIAIELARHQPDAAGLIVQASFTSMTAMMDHVGYSRFLPRWLLNQRFDSRSKITAVQMPAFFIHGLEDDTIPFTMTQELYAAHPSSKELWLIPGADHNNLINVASEEYVFRVRLWLESLSAQAESSPATNPSP